MIYVIIPFEKATPELVGLAVETSIDTLRHTISGTDDVVLKFKEEVPDEIVSYPQYTYNEIKTILKTDRWAGLTLVKI